jgi:putative redox protein
MKVEARFLENYKFEITSDLFSYISDQAPKYGGDGAGPMPSELFLWSIASCMGQAIVHISGKLQERIGELSLTVEGTKHPEKFRYARIVVRVQSDHPEDRLKEIVKIASTHCFISNSLGDDIEIEIKTGVDP